MNGKSPPALLANHAHFQAVGANLKRTPSTQRGIETSWTLVAEIMEQCSSALRQSGSSAKFRAIVPEMKMENPDFPACAELE
jgi:hypothetical protein